MSIHYDVIIINGRVVSPVGTIECDLALKDGKIVAMQDKCQEDMTAEQVVDAHGLYVLPGVIDAHIHLGFSGTVAEDLISESLSAASGGVTTCLAYIVYKQSYEDLYYQVQEREELQSYINYGFHYAIVSKAQRQEMEGYVHTHQVPSFKFFMTSKGSESKRLGLEEVSDDILFEFLKQCHSLKALPCVHCENLELFWGLKPEIEARGLQGLKAWHHSRPGFTEAEAIFRAVYLAEKAGCPSIYIVHLSSKEGLDMIRWLRGRNLNIRIIVETCVHYLTLDDSASAEDLAKVNPPIRAKEDIEALWEGIMKEEIEVVGSDHVARLKATKQGGIWQASPGFPGTRTLLPLILDEGVHKRGLSLAHLSRLLSTSPAKIFGLSQTKGSITVGADADLTIVDLNLEKEILASESNSLADYDVNEGRKVKGWPVYTIVNGQFVLQDGELINNRIFGKYVGRKLT